jgi:hypothetical protein
MKTNDKAALERKEDCKWCEITKARHNCDMPLCDGCIELVRRLDPFRFLILENTTAQQRRRMALEFNESKIED